MSLRRTLTISMLVLGLCLVLGATMGQADTEPNDEASSSEAIGQGTHQGNLTVGSDEDDWYSFSTTPGQIITVDLVATTETSPVRCFLVPDAQSIQLDGWELRSMASERVSGTLVTSGETSVEDWLVHVHCSEENGSYQLWLALEDPNDAGSGEDAPSRCSEAMTIGEGDHEGLLGSMDVSDAYTMEVRTGWVVTFELSNTGAGTVNMSLLDACDGEPLATMSASEGGTAKHSWEVPEGPTFALNCYMTMKGETGGGGSGGEEERQDYTLSVEIDKSANPPDDVLPVLGPDPVIDAVRGKDVEVTIAVTDDNEVSRAVLYYRTGDGGNWSSVEMGKEGDEWSASIPEEDLGDSDELEYYVEAFDRWGNSATHGSETSPRSVELQDEDKDDGPGFGALLALTATLTVASMSVQRRRLR